MGQFFKKNEAKVIVYLGLILFILVFLTHLLFAVFELGSVEALQKNSMEEIQKYFDTNPSFEELTTFFTNVSNEQTAVEALNILINARLPLNIDTHLMGHFVASELYKQKGVDGLEYCTSDIGYACAHAIVIASLFERGVAVFDDINDICARAEGGGAYSMCFHGFGHGVLAYAEYELPQAIELCEKVGTEEFEYDEVTECVGGMIMEMRGGIHDPELWEKNGKKYLDKDKPLDLCGSEIISEKYKVICYVYITPFIFDSIGSQDLPTFEEYKIALNKCDELTVSEYREACYGGFAKEFVSFVYGRDIRKIADPSDADLKLMLDACYLSDAEDGVRACIFYSLNALYRTGDYPYTGAGRYCRLVDNKYRQYCIDSFKESVLWKREKDLQFKDEICTYIEENYGQVCNF